ncbi:mannose-1-phosphate guanylyltransferase [Dethiosulfatarculus sandiegensis]|uniref:mannose-1-phosphate guanylyltransferase n=1 Tax=Dethiosulfatarculus sandiegensis TaxID=1429043 RepID=A0A0D2HXI7_9BACT|nr:mannose-1-phosphate guanylyltransferase [Dethiosulfatarculus sandiegensis]KIX15008.1 mannose-1-phosphate guanylyltransferase [Dethiosulfatarculus sandiegensis]
MYSVIMAGGSGTRFWPASRKDRPKQLLALTGERSLLQQTVDRMAPLTPCEQVLVVTGANHSDQVRDQLSLVPKSQVLAEPMGRNTAAAAGLAAAWVAKKDPSAVCLVLPADHLITDESLFMGTLKKAAQKAISEDVLVTLGLTPHYPATGFGYIEAGTVVDETQPKVMQVAAFHEKPDLETARSYLDSGRYFWNSGMFAWRAEVLLAEIRRHLPKLADGLDELAPSLGTPQEAEALARVYPELPAISVDHGILEKTSELRVVKADFGWSDVGSWEAMADLWPKDKAENASRQKEVLAIDATGNVVDAGDRLVALLGVKDLAAVVTDDVLMILPKDRAQDVRLIIEALKEKGLEKYL